MTFSITKYFLGSNKGIKWDSPRLGYPIVSIFLGSHLSLWFSTAWMTSVCFLCCKRDKDLCRQQTSVHWLCLHWQKFQLWWLCEVDEGMRNGLYSQGSFKGACREILGWVCSYSQVGKSMLSVCIPQHPASLLLTSSTGNWEKKSVFRKVGLNRPQELSIYLRQPGQAKWRRCPDQGIADGVRWVENFLSCRFSVLNLYSDRR